MPKLHDFQREVIEGLSDLQRQGRGRRRAVVSLPTGAGKTRAVAEAAVQLVLAPDARPDGRAPLVLWVAQAEELCEQAIETFRAVWAHRGRAARPLRVLRLWGGHPSPSPRDNADPTLVVATIQTLAMRRELEALAWLRRPALVVIDECHHSVAPSYTELLRFVGAAVGSERRAEEPMLVGLSATPFRADDEESRRLSARYDRRVLPAPETQESLPKELVKRGVLAQAELTAAEVPFRADWPEQERFLELLEMYERLGRAAEGSGQEGETAADRERIGIELEQLLEGGNQCLALDERRNRMLIERIREHRARSVLLFANSLEHAERLAARLTLAGIPAAAVHGETDRGTRRYHIERFRAGELRVLCNYQLLSVGFDAPQVELVVISRLVFSRVRYMQMVGRGLRGPKNGGTERCEVLTLIDNIGRFPSLHPWHYAKEYFDRIGAG
ncbi:MAG: DEAD/DEAH box helicase [Xanthomonadales bacterium]|nr:DEAD/DEAH box helicase [Xanthomonadales bacterium]